MIGVISCIERCIIFLIERRNTIAQLLADCISNEKDLRQVVIEDFDQKKLPLMLSMINAIVDDKKLELDWESFR